MNRNIIIKQIISESTGKDPEYSYSDIKPLIVDDVKEFRKLTNDCLRRISTINSMALRAQKRGYDYSEQIRSNAWELKEDVKEFFQIRNRVLNKIEKSIGEIPFSIHEYFIKVFSRILFTADSAVKSILGFNENPKKVIEFCSQAEDALSKLNDSMYTLTNGKLY